jgi:hypothetical protein
MVTKLIETVATSSEGIIHTQKLGFSIGEAQLLAIECLSDNNASVQDITTVSSNRDVYDLLEGDDVAQVLDTHSYLGVITCGWASPISKNEEPDEAPSKHPDRRRVRLMLVANRSEVFSVLRFEDNPDEVITDDGKATGSLADALIKAINKKGKRNGK